MSIDVLKRVHARLEVELGTSVWAEHSDWDAITRVSGMVFWTADGWEILLPTCLEGFMVRDVSGAMGLPGGEPCPNGMTGDSFSGVPTRWKGRGNASRITEDLLRFLEYTKTHRPAFARVGTDLVLPETT